MIQFNNYLYKYSALLLFDIFILAMLDTDLLLPLPKNPWIYYLSIPIVTGMSVFIASTIFNMPHGDVRYSAFIMIIIGSLIFNKSQQLPPLPNKSVNNRIKQVIYYSIPLVNISLVKYLNYCDFNLTLKQMIALSLFIGYIGSVALQNKQPNIISV